VRARVADATRRAVVEGEDYVPDGVGEVNPAAMDQPAWDDPSWQVGKDNAWQAGLRWQQCWWRAERLGLPAGPFSKRFEHRLVGSTLAFDAPRDANYLTAAVADAVERRLGGAGSGGLISEDRLRRSLLSSQPM
jgi:hypothetical protein